jgi:hypothetical protein
VKHEFSLTEYGENIDGSSRKVASCTHARLCAWQWIADVQNVFDSSLVQVIGRVSTLSFSCLQLINLWKQEPTAAIRVFSFPLESIQ